MDRERLERLAEDPRFIPGIYNYCDRWCERCAFTSRCITYAMDEPESDDPEAQDIHNKVFWDKLHGIFELTMEMIQKTADRMGIDLDSINTEEYAHQNEIVRKKAKEQPYSKAAMRYAEKVKNWFDSNKKLLEEKAEELQSLALADVPDVIPADDAININDCLEMVR